MKCSWVKEQLSGYLDDELCPLDVKKVEKHLQQCESCRREYENVRGTSKLIGSLGEITPPADFCEQVLNSTTRETEDDVEKKAKSVFDLVLPVKHVAAVLMGVLLLGNGVIFTFYEGDEYAENDQQNIELTQEEHEEFLERMAGVLNRDYYSMVTEEADVTMASSVGEVDMSRYEKNGRESEAPGATPFMVFNGVFLPFAATLMIISKKSERGE